MEGNRSLLIRMLRYVPDRLPRVTDSTRFIPEIDGMRFVAIMAVVWYHLLGVISFRKLGVWDPRAFDGIPVFGTLTSGHFGVPLFFVISGFILAVPFAYQHLKGAPAKPLNQYYLRWLSRLGPPYVLWLCILFTAQVVRGQAPLSDWPHLAASLGYVHNMVYGLAVRLAWDAAAVAAWVWAWTHVKGGSWYQILLPVAVLVAYLGSMRGLVFSTIFRNKIIYTIGGTCYTIYLWHQPLLMAWGRYGLPRFWRDEWSLGANVALQTLLATMIVLPVCAVLFVFIEKPFMKPRWWVRTPEAGGAKR